MTPRAAAAEAQNVTLAKPVRRSRRRTAESSLVRTILEGCAARRVPCFRLNSGAFVLNQGATRRFFRAGFKGCPDLMVMLGGGRIGFIEAKAQDGRLSPDQLWFQILCREFGVPHLVGRTWEAVERWLEQGVQTGK